MTELVTLERFTALASGAAQAESLPAIDSRTTRYYTTLGLMSRPVIKDRIALYGRTQLIEVFAIRRLQAAGLKLGQIQPRLAGMSAAALAALASVPQEALTQLAPNPAPKAAAKFWAAPPTPPAKPALPMLTGLPLADNVHLLFESATLTDEDITILTHAAQPLLDALKSIWRKP